MYSTAQADCVKKEITCTLCLQTNDRWQNVTVIKELETGGGVMVIVVENGQATRVQILDETDCIHIALIPVGKV